MIFTLNQSKGESIIEILLAIALFSIVLPAVLYTLGSFAGSQPQNNMYFNAIMDTEETKSTIQEMKAVSWDTVSQNGTYTLNALDNTLNLLITTPTPDPDGFIKTIQISDVQRNNGVIVSEGGTVDSATKKISISIDWETNNPLVSDFYITRTDKIETSQFTSVDDFSLNDPINNGTTVISSGLGDDGEVTINNSEIEPEISLKSWWKMNGDHAISRAEVDSAPNGANNLQIIGSPVFSQGRFDNKVGLLSQSNYLVASSTASLEMVGQISLVAWIKLETPSTDSPIVYKQATNSGYSFAVDSQGKIYGQIRNGVDSIIAKNEINIVDDNKWHQVALTYDGTVLRVYVDGLVGDVLGNGVAILSSNTQPLFIGINPSTRMFFEGDIDDVQVYNTALSEEEIKNLLFAKYTSPIQDFGKNILVHSISTQIYQPENTKVKLQIALTKPTTGSCQDVYYQYLGPDQTSDTYFESSETGETNISSQVPESLIGKLINPGQCLRWRAYFYSANDYGTNNPNLKETIYVYSL